MHWLDMIKVRDLMHTEVVSPDAASAAPSSALARAPASADASRARGARVEPLRITPEATLRNACGLMIEHDRDRLLVMQHARAVGTLCAMDVVRYLASGAGL